MPFPLKVCVLCEEEFELRPDKPGYANRCPDCSTSEAPNATATGRAEAFDRQSQAEANEARRQAMRNLLYRKDS